MIGKGLAETFLIRLFSVLGTLFVGLFWTAWTLRGRNPFCVRIAGRTCCLVWAVFLPRSVRGSLKFAHRCLHISMDLGPSLSLSQQIRDLCAQFLAHLRECCHASLMFFPSLV